MKEEHGPGAEAVHAHTPAPQLHDQEQSGVASGGRKVGSRARERIRDQPAICLAGASIRPQHSI